MMRKILLSIFAFTSLTLHAQNFSVEVPDTTIYGTATMSTFYEDIDIYNDLGTTLDMSWERIEESIPLGWTTSNCDPDQCHPEGVISGSFSLLASGGYLNTHFYPNGVDGSGYMKIKLWETANPADSVVLTYYGTTETTVGINELAASDIQIFPSPAQHTVNIVLPNSDEAIHADIFNVNGQRAKSFDMVQGNLVSIDISDLEMGVYIIHFNVPNKGIITKKFIKA